MKKIELKVTPVGPTFTHVKVSVATQTHRGTDFNNGSRTFRASNGFVLYSGSYPRLVANELHVLGDVRYYDGDVVMVTVATLAAIQTAVSEYNKKHAEFVAPAPLRPQAIEVAVKPIGPDFKNVEVTVVKQTHLLNQFGTATVKGNGEFVFGDIRLASSKGDRVGLGAYVPPRLVAKGVKKTFYVAHSVAQVCTPETLTATVSVADWNKVLPAIQAFNRAFAAPAPAPAPARDCSYIIG